LTGTASQATNTTNIGTTNDIATNAAHFVVFVGQRTAGNNAAKVASTKLTFNPSTGVLTATGFAGPLTGNVTGNADTATKLATARAINGVNFDGSAPITVTANTPNAVTFNNSGTGAATGTAFTGAAAVVVSYNTLGCAGLSANNTFTGTNAFNGTSLTSSAATVDLATGTGPTLVNLGAGATASGSAKALNIGTGGLAGSLTTINFGNAAGTVTYTFNGFSGVTLPVGTTANRPAGSTGLIRFNTDLVQFEGYNGTSWTSVGGGAKGGGADQAFFENDIAITASYTITTNKNAMTAGPITINTGATVTIPTGSTWTIV
jgi:hypothetical protein